MNITAVGKGDETDGYLVVCRLWFGKYLLWRNPRCGHEKGEETVGRSHDLSSPKWTG